MYPLIDAPTLFFIQVEVFLQKMIKFLNITTIFIHNFHTNEYNNIVKSIFDKLNIIC